MIYGVRDIKLFYFSNLLFGLYFSPHIPSQFYSLFNNKNKQHQTVEEELQPSFFSTPSFSLCTKTHNIMGPPTKLNLKATNQTT